jgi:polysaccharide deacetylase family protein (PEP-CTERM system associated)
VITPPPAAVEIVNVFTIDVDEHFHDFALSALAPPVTWDDLPSRVEANVERVLDLLAEHDVRATFFTLGWVAERHAQLIRKIVDDGHELASCGYAHVRATDQSYGKFLADIRLAKAVLEDVSGSPVKGFRAPGLSLVPSNFWAFDCVVEAGYRYSSSLYPAGRRRGANDVPRFAHEIRPGLIEMPVSTVRALRANLPAGGSDTFRLLPYPFVRWSIRRIHAVDHQPAVFHFHPWELDLDEPPLGGLGRPVRYRHYANRAQMEPRLRQLLAEFRWGRADHACKAT